MDAHDGNTTSTKSISSLEIVVSPKAKQVEPLIQVDGESLPVEECLEKFQIEELEDEIKDLIDDQVYNEFVVAIAKENPIDREYPNDDCDEQFIPKYVCAEKISEINGEEAEDPMESYEELSSSSESETSTVIENEGYEVTTQLIQDSDVCPDELDLIKNNVPVAVPKSSLKKTHDRYPPFWRLKHAIRNVGENDGYKSEEDADFLPENEEVENENVSAEGEEKSSDMKDQNDSSSMSYQSSDEEKFDHEELEQEVKGLQEMPDLKQDVKGLSDMVQEMSFVSDQQTAQNVDTYNEDMEEGNDHAGFSPIHFAEAIIQFDDADYDEKADPDYEPPISDGNADESNFDDSNYNEESDPDYEPSNKNESNVDPNVGEETDVA